MTNAASRLRYLLIVAIVAGQAITPGTSWAQPGRPDMPFGRLTLPVLRDGSRDFDFLQGNWRIIDGRLTKPLSGPQGPATAEGRLVGRVLRRGAVTIEWDVLGGDSIRERGSARMEYDPRTMEWRILERRAGASAQESSVVGHFESEQGAFYGIREYANRSVLVRMTWNVTRPGQARFEQAYSADGGMTWETNRIMHLAVESTQSGGRTSEVTHCCGRMELAWYTVPVGMEHAFADLVARESRAMGDSGAAQNVALLRSADRPTAFLLVRGFSDDAHATRFYQEGWPAQRAALEPMKVQFDSVYEVFPAFGREFIVGKRIEEPLATGSGLIVATLYIPDPWERDRSHFEPFLIRSVIPQVTAAGARLLAVFRRADLNLYRWTGERDSSAVAGRPVPFRREVLVAFTWFANERAYEQSLATLQADPYWRDTVGSGFTRFLTREPGVWRVVPVGPSRAFLDWRERWW